MIIRGSCWCPRCLLDGCRTSWQSLWILLVRSLADHSQNWLTYYFSSLSGSTQDRSHCPHKAKNYYFDAPFLIVPCLSNDVMRLAVYWAQNDTCFGRLIYWSEYSPTPSKPHYNQLSPSKRLPIYFWNLIATSALSHVFILVFCSEFFGPQSDWYRNFQFAIWDQPF